MSEPHTCHERDERFEEFDVNRGMFGVFNVEEPYSATLIAAFQSEAEAVAWIATLTIDRESDDYRNIEYLQALPIVDVTGRFWNSYDPVPA